MKLLKSTSSQLDLNFNMNDDKTMTGRVFKTQIMPVYARLYITSRATVRHKLYESFRFNLILEQLGTQRLMYATHSTTHSLISFL